jgi:hypothetical protein
MKKNKMGRACSTYEESCQIRTKVCSEDTTMAQMNRLY